MAKCQLQQDKKPIGLIIKLFVADGEYIVGNLNELYQFRILGDARMEGSNAVYKVELGGGNTQGVPKSSGHVKPLLIDSELLNKDNEGQAITIMLCAA